MSKKLDWFIGKQQKYDSFVVGQSKTKEKTMSAYDILYKAYTEARKNNFWDAWGIVASPRFICELRAECMERMVVHNANIGALEKIFGLVVIPRALLDDETCYVVDEQLGRTILGYTEKGQRNDI